MSCPEPLSLLIYSSTTLFELRCRVIGSFSIHCTNQWPCSYTALLKKGSVLRKNCFPHSVLADAVRVKYRQGTLSTVKTVDNVALSCHL